MCKDRTSLKSIVVPLIVALALIFFVSAPQLAYAKGAHNTQNSGNNSSGSSSSDTRESGSQSQNNSSNDHSSNSNSGNSNYQSGSSNHDNSGYSNSNNNSNNSGNGNSGYSNSNNSSNNSGNSSYTHSDSSGGSQTYHSSSHDQVQQQDNSRHDPPPSSSNHDNSSYTNSNNNSNSSVSSGSSTETKHEQSSQGNTYYHVEPSNQSGSGNSNYNSGNSNSTVQQDDPRHKPPSNIRQDTSNNTRSNSNSGQITSTPSSGETQHAPIVGGPSGSHNGGSVVRSGSIGRVQDHSDSRDSGFSPAGSYRKDYSDLGQIWRSRRESTNSSRDHNNRGGHDNHGGGGVHININFFPASYRFYTYDYVPGFAYPSLYCYYYGVFPPYILRDRVFYIHRIFPAVIFVEIPIDVFHYDSYAYDGYYSSEWRYRSLSGALRDIQRAWERTDIDLIMDHVRSDTKIDVSLHGEYAYSVNDQDYHDMTLDAMNNIRTESFEFYDVKWHDGREAVAYGKHIYYDDNENGDRMTVYVKYRMEKTDGEWYITEVGTSPDELY